MTNLKRNTLVLMRHYGWDGKKSYSVVRIVAR